MQSLRHPPRPFSALLRTALTTALATALLSACGGGGDAAGDDGRPTVTGTTIVDRLAVTAPRYSRTALLTVNGTNLAGGTIAVASPGCTGMTLSTTAPNVSSATTAYYTCTVAAMGAQTATITRAADGAALATAAYDVPAPQVTMTVSNGAAVAGSMVITLAPDKTPITVDNFLFYVNSGFYDGTESAPPPISGPTIFHRVVNNFVIQGGGFLPITTLPAVLKPPTRPAIPLEVNKGLSNIQWTIAMARTSVPDSATSQFFINVVNNAASLDPGPTAGYAVFGSVTSNTALVSAIVGSPCTPIAGFSECAPNPNMVISKAEQTR